MRHARFIVFLAAAILTASLVFVTLSSGCARSSSITTSVSTATSAPVGKTTSSSERVSTTPAAPPSPPSSTTGPTTPPASIPQNVQDALARMNVEAKAAQVLMVTVDGATLSAAAQGALAQATPGGVVLIGRNVRNKEQLTSLTKALQAAAARAKAPALFVAADEEGGPVLRVKEGVPPIPAARTLGSDSTPAHAKSLARAAATAVRSQGVNMVLAPVADVVRDKGSFLYQRSYSADEKTVSAFVTAVIQGFAGGGMITVVKHFPGHGSAPEDSHTAVPVSAATAREFATIHLPPFRAAIAAGVEGVMVGHFVAPPYDGSHPASQSSAVIQLLRRDLGFAGLVVSDDLEMSAATGASGAVGSASPTELGKAAVAALSAGCDLLIATSTLDREAVIQQALVAAVRAGTLSEARLDEAVYRILTVKAAHDLSLGSR